MKEKARRVMGFVRARKSNSQTNRFLHPFVSTPRNLNANSPKSMKLKMNHKKLAIFIYKNVLGNLLDLTSSAMLANATVSSGHARVGIYWLVFSIARL